MHTNPDEFEQLRRLLTVKRHEQPPPRYFQEFPARVMARLEAMQTIDSISWFERLMQVFELKPVLTGAFGVAAFTLLLIGLVSFERPEDPSLTVGSVAGAPRLPVANSQGGMVINQLATGDALQSSIDPAINTQPTSALFDNFQLGVQRTSFNPGGN